MDDLFISDKEEDFALKTEAKKCPANITAGRAYIYLPRIITFKCNKKIDNYKHTNKKQKGSASLRTQPY